MNTSPLPRDLKFPEDQDPEAFHSTSVIGGEFGITAKLSKLEDIIEWQEGRRKFTRGYYRLVEGPQLSRLQQGFSRHFSIRHAIAFSSLPSALLELLELLFNRYEESRLKVIWEHLDPGFSFLVNSLQSLRRPVTFFPGNLEDPLKNLESGKQQVLLIALKKPLHWMQNHQEQLKAVTAAKIPIVVCSPSFTAFEVFPENADYWVTSLSCEKDGISVDGGIVLGNKDRQMNELREIRKKRGNVLSLRSASIMLENLDQAENLPSPKTGNTNSADSKQQVLNQLCRLEEAESGLLYPSGMSAISSVVSLLRRPEKPKVIVIGLLYTDTYGFLESPFRGKKDTTCYLKTDEIDQLEQHLDDQTACILTETITNPLLEIPDLEQLGRISQKNHIPLVIDNTLATPVNCKPLDWGADLVIHSTSKYLNGNNNHGGGVALFRTDKWKWVMERYHQQWGLEPGIHEIRTLLQNLEDFGERMERFNSNGVKAVDFLQKHPAVEKVFHGSLTYQERTSPEWLMGYGSVVSFTLISGNLESLRLFYDQLPAPLLKAPTLGSNQTLVCPYALLAHYHEPPSFFEHHSIPRHLVRLAVGCEEDLDPVFAALDQGLNQIL